MVYLTVQGGNGGAKMNIPFLKHQIDAAFTGLEEKYSNSKAMSSFLEKMGEVYEIGLPQVMNIWVRVIK